MNELVAPRRFRRRLTLATVAFVGLASGFLAVTSYFLFREYRFRISTRQADRRVELAIPLLPANPTPAAVDATLAEYRLRGGFDAVIVARGREYSSLPDLHVDDVPAELRNVTRHNRHGFTTLDGESYRVVGRLADDGSTRLYVFFPRAEMLASITQFGNVLAVGWLATLLFAAIAGQLVARKTLQPIREAALAARRLSSRLLDERPRDENDDEFGLWVDSFNEVAVELEGKIAQLSEAAQRERRFTADVAHELRTPLTGMTTAATMLAEHLDELPGAAREPAGLLVRDVQRLRDLVLELLELARLDAGSEPTHLEPLAVEPAVETVVRQWCGHASDVDVDVDVEPELFALADRARFKRVLGNLVANAVEHGRAPIEVRAWRDGDRVRIDVRDNGPGIERVDLERVFDRFFKADTSRSRRGSGLGLAIALEHARGQGGDLRVVSGDGNGTCFTFWLRAAMQVDRDGDGLVTAS
jgi:two-component system sensor histidine kinase MtrB